MKKAIAIIFGMLSVFAFVLSANADLDSNAKAHVWVDVVPNVAVGVLSSSVDIGDVQTGNFSATIMFRVDANMEDVNLQPVASMLYKGDDPTNQDVAPIPLNTGAGVLIQPTNANPTAGASNIARALEPANIDGFEGFRFDQINFESSQNGHFSQDVAITVTWLQDDPEKPQGEYSGYVQLFCLLTP